MSLKIMLAASAAALSVAGAAYAQTAGSSRTDGSVATVGGVQSGVNAGTKADVAGESSLGRTASGGDPAARTTPPTVPPSSARSAGASAQAASASAADANASGLEPGLPVRSSSGAMIGTVSKVETSADGKVSSITVMSADGSQKSTQLTPGSFSVSNGVVIAGGR